MINFALLFKQSKKSYKNSGRIHLIHCATVKAYSFVDYIQGGTELACTIAIDFTASNGKTLSPARGRCLLFIARLPAQFFSTLQSYCPRLSVG